MKNKISIALLLAGAAVALFLYFRYRVAPDLPFASLQLHDTEGKPVSMNEFKGKAVFLNFWATWCGDCRREMPSIEKAKAQFADDEIVFVLISDEEASKVKAFAESKKYPFRFLISDIPLKDLEIYAIPTTYLLDKNGKMVMRKVGGENWADEDNLKQIRAVAGK